MTGIQQDKYRPWLENIKAIKEAVKHCFSIFGYIILVALVVIIFGTILEWWYVNENDLIRKFILNIFITESVSNGQLFSLDKAVIAAVTIAIISITRTWIREHRL